MSAPLEPRARALAFARGLIALALGVGDAPACGDGTEHGTAAPATETTTVALGGTSSAAASTGVVATESSAAGGSTASPADASSDDSAGARTSGELAGCDAALPEHWIDGTDCAGEPTIMIHQADPDTVVLRQSLCTSYEGPFMYLLFGQDRVLLEDTGDGGIPIAATVYDIIDQWLAANGKDHIELVVVNSHAHGDHVAGNPQFVGQPNTTVVEPSVAGLSAFFGITDWPNQTVGYDLGGRMIDVVPIPGHQAAHIALFDHGTGWLLTGDTLYPGRLYIEDFAAYVASIERMVEVIDPAAVCQVMGTHVEMTNAPGVDFEFGADEHPDEHPLQLEWDHLVELHEAVLAMPSPQYEVHSDFIIYPL